MKHIFCKLLFIIICFGNIQAQNFDFEEWENNGTFTYPKNWECKVCYQSTDAYSNNYAIMTHTWYNNVKGKFWIDSQHGDNYEQGVAINQRPLTFTGHYKYIDVAPNDSAVVKVTLTKYNSTLNKPDTIGYSIQLLPPANSYSSFTVNIQYNSSSIPDTLYVMFLSSKGDPISPDAQAMLCSGSTDCSFLYVDSLNFNPAISLGLASFAKKKISINVFPNPFSESTTISIEGLEYLGNATFTLYNVLGEKVKSFTVNTPTFSIQREGLQSGVYFYQLNDEKQNSFNGKIVLK